jgi:DNA-binding transcriptional regulator YiaG
MHVFNRRSFLYQSAALAATAGPLGRLAAREAQREPLPVAAVVTEYRENSHADVILGKILAGFDQRGGPGPALKLVGLYTDQDSKADLSRGLAEKHGFHIAETIDEALTLGTDRLQVAGVLSIGEHGAYPYTPDTKQHMYPRRRFFDGIAETFRRVGQVVPVFNDKHLSYRWSDARHMFDLAAKMKIPLMAGSSLPVTWRRPALSLPIGCEIESALAIGYGGLESYGFHALETLQCMVERRAGGETGVAAIRVLQGEEIEQARAAGQWSEELFAAALRTTPGAREPDLKRLGKNAAFYQLEYRDGLKATVAMASGIATQFAFAARLRGQQEPVASWFELEEEKPYGHFAHLLRAVEHMVHTGRPAYPVERTLLTTGVLDAVMHSLADNGRRRETPELAVAYKPADWTFANRDE